MKKKLSALEKMLLLSISFTIVLLVIRIYVATEQVYLFYPWNLFLAVVPMMFSRRLKHYKKVNWKSFLLLAGWLLFFPNAPYLLTDIFHFKERLPVPYWFDLLLVISGAWNGLVLGIASLMQVEQFLSKTLNTFWLGCFTLFSFLLCGYGVYIGRFLRFNSWWVFTKPKFVIRSSASNILLPQDHLQLWAFTFVFAIFMSLIYFTLKKLPSYISVRR